MDAPDISARELASALDIALTIIQMLISGKSDISSAMAIQLAAAVDSSEGF